MKRKSASRSAFFNRRVLIGFVLCSIGLLLAVVGWSKSATDSFGNPVLKTGMSATMATAQTPGTWAATGSMNVGRKARFTATLLTNGKVLVAGGCLGAPDDPYCHTSATAGVEIYDPSSGIWTSAHSMATPRIAHTATRLADGKVLVAGGEG